MSRNIQSRPVVFEPRDLLAAAVSFGLITGMVEAVLFLILQQSGRIMNVWIEILWISPIVDALMFLPIALLMAAVARILQRKPKQPFSVFPFILLACFDWLAVSLVLTEIVHRVAVLILAIGAAAQLTRWLTRRGTKVLAVGRKSLPWIGTLMLIVLLGVQGGQWLKERKAISNLPTAPTDSPNILVIVIDALRADHLSSYGYERRTSPNIDMLAEQGTLFENAFSTASYTLPSHASLLTGLYPHAHGAQWTTPKAISTASYPTLAEVLSSRGYRTAAFSANTFWFTREQGFGRGFAHFEDYFRSISDMALRTLYGRIAEKLLVFVGYEDIPARKRATDINEALLSWLERDPKVPFFAFLNLMDVHDPYLPPQPYRNQFSGREAPGGILNWRLGREDPQMTGEQLQSEIDAYDGAIAFVDDQIGQLLDAMSRRAPDHNTLIVITSDHGEAFGEHQMFLHAKSLYLEEIRVPLIFWQPGKVPGSLRIAEPVSNASLPATVMDLLGADTGAFSIIPTLKPLWEKPDGIPNRPYPMAEMEQRPWVSKKYPVHHGSLRSIVGPRWHFIAPEASGPELYEWTKDPLESSNLFGDPGTQAIVVEFTRALK